MPVIEMTYCRATDSWAVWFVPREPNWTPAGMWKLLGAFTSFDEANDFMYEMERPSPYYLDRP